MAKEIKIGHFCLSNPVESNTCTHVYLAKPEIKFLEKFGRLSILVSLNFKDKAPKHALLWAKKWTQELTDFIKNDFYNPTKPVADIEKEFEDSLQRINSWLQQEKARQTEIFKKHLLDFDIDIILIKDNNIYFSQIGEIETYFIKNDKLTNLVQEKNKSTKFSNIISGKLEKDTILFFASKNLFNYFSSGKIVQILKQSPAQKVESEIKRLLSDQVNRVSLLALIISNLEHVSIPAKAKVEPVEKPLPEAGAGLVTKAPHPTSPLAKSKAGGDTAPLAQTEETQIEKTIPKKEIKKQVLGKIREPRKQQIKQKIWGKPKKVKPALPNLPIIKARRLTYLRKSLLILLIVVALLFIQSVVILSRQQLKTQQNKKYAQLIENLRTKQDDLSAALIYQDSITIKTISNETKALLNQLPQKTQEQKETYQHFQEKYTQQMNKFYHLITIDEPVLLIDLKQNYKDIKTNGLTNIGNDFYIFNTDNNYIYLFDLETKEIELVNQASANVGRVKKFIPLDNDSLIGFDQNQGIVSFNTIDEKLIPLKLNRTNMPEEIQDICVYNRRLYTLEPSFNQIYKHSKTIDGFSQEQAWIQDQAIDISSALSFAIDGSIYIFKKTGQILEIYQGKKVEFELDNIQPSLSVQDPNILQPQGKIKIYTNADLKYLYLLDGPTKRLIVLNKDGKLIKQFTNNQFEDLKDFIISKKEDKAWLLAGTKIFEIEI